MVDLFPREVVPFPAYNTSEFTTLDGLPYNLTTLQYWNYTLYSNNTVSNASDCILVFGKYSPAGMLSNGSWVNETSCYNPILRVGPRAFAGLPFAAIFGIIIILALTVLRKHGQLMLPELKRFRGVGRRWTWYWMTFSAACGLISCITGIDVDRSYVQYLPVILTSFFFILMVPVTFAMVWEMTRHWGSWQLRQIMDRDDYAFLDNDRRAKFEFFVPMVFYFFAWMYFFMTIPRNWDPVQLQRSTEQIAVITIPSVTDGRFKASVFMLVICWLIILASLLHSLRHYQPTNPRPTKIIICLVLLSVKIGYLGAMAWSWKVSMFNAHVNVVYPFVLGFLPDALIMMVMLVASGIGEDNEDLQLVRQRRQRDQLADQDLGYVPKPKWWHLGKTDEMGRHLTRDQRLRVFAQANTGFDKKPTTQSGLGGPAAFPLNEMSPSTAGPGAAWARDGVDSRPSIPSALQSDTAPPPAYKAKDDRSRAQNIQTMLDV